MKSILKLALIYFLLIISTLTATAFTETGVSGELRMSFKLFLIVLLLFSASLTSGTTLIWIAVQQLPFVRSQRSKFILWLFSPFIPLLCFTEVYFGWIVNANKFGHNQQNVVFILLLSIVFSTLSYVISIMLEKNRSTLT